MTHEILIINWQKLNDSMAVVLRGQTEWSKVEREMVMKSRKIRVKNDICQT